MNKSNTPKLDAEEEKIKKAAENGIDEVDALYHHVKNKASEYYEESKRTVSDVQDNLKEYTDNLIEHVKEKPLTSLLIAGGIGFILSSLLKK